MFVHLGGDHYLPAGTAARWSWLVAQAKAKYGVALRITGGWNGYRPYDVQVQYRKDLGIWAAVPGTSSHGLIWRGLQVAAVDVNNWGELGWGRFAGLCRLAGFTVDFVSPQELWHIGDLNDIWTVPAFAASGGGTTWKPAPELKKEDIMANIPPLVKQANSDNIWAINSNGTKRRVKPDEMSVYKSIAGKLKIDINSYIAEGDHIKLSSIPNG
jgi:hypothetical protein